MSLPQSFKLWGYRFVPSYLDWDGLLFYECEWRRGGQKSMTGLSLLTSILLLLSTVLCMCCGSSVLSACSTCIPGALGGRTGLSGSCGPLH